MNANGRPCCGRCSQWARLLLHLQAARENKVGKIQGAQQTKRAKPDFPGDREIRDPAEINTRCGKYKGRKIQGAEIMSLQPSTVNIQMKPTVLMCENLVSPAI